MKNYEQLALLFAEKYGTPDYQVIGNKMKYKRKYICEGSIALVTVNLDTMEETREMIKIEEEK